MTYGAFSGTESFPVILSNSTGYDIHVTETSIYAVGYAFYYNTTLTETIQNDA